MRPITTGRPNCCYENAFAEFLARKERGEDPVYVHGSVTSWDVDRERKHKQWGGERHSPEPLDHAWVEVDGEVVDPTPFKHGEGDYSRLQSMPADEYLIEPSYVGRYSTRTPETDARVAQLRSLCRYVREARELVERMLTPTQALKVYKVKDIVGKRAFWLDSGGNLYDADNNHTAWAACLLDVPNDDRVYRLMHLRGWARVFVDRGDRTIWLNGPELTMRQRATMERQAIKHELALKWEKGSDQLVRRTIELYVPPDQVEEGLFTPGIKLSACKVNDIAGHRAFWLDSGGNLYRVDSDHPSWALAFLGFSDTGDDDHNVYALLQRKGWERVVVNREDRTIWLNGSELTRAQRATMEKQAIKHGYALKWDKSTVYSGGGVVELYAPPDQVEESTEQGIAQLMARTLVEVPENEGEDGVQCHDAVHAMAREAGKIPGLEDVEFYTWVEDRWDEIGKAIGAAGFKSSSAVVNDMLYDITHGTVCGHSFALAGNRALDPHLTSRGVPQAAIDEVDTLLADIYRRHGMGPRSAASLVESLADATPMKTIEGATAIWLSPEGTMYSAYRNHVGWVAAHMDLKADDGTILGAYSAMQDLGWMRVAVDRHESTIWIGPAWPNRAQRDTIEREAIANEMRLVLDGVNKETILYEPPGFMLDPGRQI